MSDILEGGRFNLRWLMEASMIEAFREDREFTMLGTIEAGFTKLSWEVKQLGWLFLRESGLEKFYLEVE